MIRMVAGLIILMAAAGTSDHNLDSSLAQIALMALAGSALILLGAIKEAKKSG